MLPAAVVDIGMMLLSGLLSAGVHSAMMMLVVTGALPVLAITTVCAIESGVQGRSVWPVNRQGGELRTLAARLAAPPLP